MSDDWQKCEDLHHVGDDHDPTVQWRAIGLICDACMERPDLELLRAEVERLREALGKIKEYHRQGAAGECGEGPWDMAYEHVCWIAREALGEKP